MEGVIPDAPDWSHSEKLAYEKEVLGFYLTSHPLTEYADVIQRHSAVTTKDISQLPEDAEVLIGGMISSISRRTTKKPSRNGHTRYVHFDLEDVAGTLRCTMWPEQYAKLGEKVQAEQVCFVRGRIDRRGREPNLIVNELLTIDEADRELTRQLILRFQRGLHSEQEMLRVRDLIRQHPGKTPVVVLVDSADPADPTRRRRYVLSPAGEFRVCCSPEFLSQLRALLGEDCFRLCGAAVQRAARKNGRSAQSPQLLLVK